MSQVKIVVFAGSVRTGSFNAKLANLAQKRLEANGAIVTRVDLKDYELPIYCGDIEEQQGVPEAARKLHKIIADHDGVVVTSPEFNSSIGPLLVNTLNWLSRVPENGGKAAIFGNKVYAISSASPGGFGGYRGLMALRGFLELGVGAHVLPEMVSIASAHEAFDEEGELKVPFADSMLTTMLEKLVEKSAKTA
ncbi:NAD(P)H-dependent FMN reductase [Cohaesibacter marisflavi]|uniref:NAD(P)H-dependent FMN reductase n=1 Tax=Cohaesibacter marisflavi TaxID=655353 RepID=A0A1I5F098_9HYPH|nr:NADPH-dependent FMN reductase [Cohaesibacter marisflavi]SFO17165.1 NAD(P)H-dependent FMN reductase [Cohaesibacter marisflavi]